MDGLSRWTGTNSEQGAPKLEFRVAAAIAAVVCAAFIGNACVERSRPAPQSVPALDGKTEHKLPADRPIEGTRSRPAAAPVEFAAVYGLAADKPYTTLAASDWSTPARKADDAPASRTPRKTVLAQTCMGECGPTAVTVVPPRRPADLTVVAQAPARDQDRRVRLLGAALPGFVPSGDTIAKTVVSWGGSIAGVIPGL